MNSPALSRFTGRHILVADEDPTVVAFVIHTLRSDGYAVFHAYDAQSAIELVYALGDCALVISNTKIAGLPGVELIRQLRRDRPNQRIMYLANIGRSTPDTEAQLPPDVPILREPFDAEELRGMVSGLLQRTGPKEARPT
jgi:two-component system, cell cycle response regulator CtrA